MPPTRRKSSNLRATQRTLSFHNRTNRITKPSSGSKSSDVDGAKNKKVTEAFETSTLSIEPETAAPLAEVEEPTTSELTIRDQVASEQVTQHGAVEEQAKRTSDADIKWYWKMKEDERKAPRGTLRHDPFKTILP